MKQYRLMNRLLAGVAFLITLVTYAMTLQPSVPWWDCGEFTSAATWQQVPHPPGAPLWLLVARFFQIFVPGEAGWAINFFSATCSAVTAALVYLTIVMMVERWRPYREGTPVMNYLATFGAGLIGTLAFTWSDTQWFNSVESEVYAGGTTLVAILIYLMMRWDQEAERSGHERYLLLMAYLVGLAFGIHLLALLVVPGVAMVIYFRTHRPRILTFAVMLGITAVAFYFFVYKAPLEYIPKLLAGDSAIVAFVIFLGVLALIWWSLKEKKATVFLAASSFALILLGFTTYTQIMIRSDAHPVMNENEPDTMQELVSYLGREQYGFAPNWPRRYKQEAYHRRVQDQYGEWFPPVDYVEGRPIFNQINLAGELNFMFRYQIYHMYIRYFLWNFMGRVSDVQDAGAVAFPAMVSPEERQRFVAETGHNELFPITFFGLPLLLGMFGVYYHFRRDWKMGLVFSTLFLLLGLLATLQQNQQNPQPRERDYFYVGSYMIFAMWIGIGAIGLVETLRQRKTSAVRDAEGNIREEYDVPQGGGLGLTAATLGGCFLAVPVLMAVNGWEVHDRSGNWAPWDYSYNVLQSCEKDAILFTNGDNDTFPLWYIQDVDGVRRDVRVVNLELAQTPWYMKQMKTERPWGARQIPLSYPTEWFDDPEGTHPELTPGLVTPGNDRVEVEVPAGVMAWATRDSLKTPGTMSWALRTTDYGQGQRLLSFKQKLVAEVIRNVKWDRPIYFSTSTYSDAWGGLEQYLRREGMAYRVMPVQQEPSISYGFPIEPTITKQSALQILPDDKFHTEPHYGFKLRNHNNPSVFFREDDRMWVSGYWELYVSLATEELQKRKDPKSAIAVLRKMDELINPDLFAMPYWVSSAIAVLYNQAGDAPKAKEYAQRAIRGIDSMGMSEQAQRVAASYPPDQVRKQMQMILDGK